MISDDAPCPTLIFYLLFKNIYFAKPGDRRWKHKQCEFTHPMAKTFFDGEIYYINKKNTICTAEPERKLATSLVPLQYNPCIPPSILVKFDSDLLLVRQTGKLKPENFEVFRVDLESNILVKLDNLGEYALFIGVNRQTVIVPSKNFPSIKGNSIYCFLSAGRFIYSSKEMPSAQTAIYSLKNESFELLSNFHHGDLLHPGTFADYLFKYCSML